MSERWMPALKYCAPSWVATCAKCGKEGYKRSMVALLVKTGSYSTPRTLCHVCKGCMAQLLDELEASMPE